MKHTAPIKPLTFYHIYNRGINGEVIFKKAENYEYFLMKYNHYISPIAETHAYCLLGNHFHFLIRTRSEVGIQTFHTTKSENAPPNKTISQLISLQFSHLFNGYTQAINKQENRTGKLFELPFRRIEVKNPAYLSQLVQYIHTNPQKHGLIDNYRDYTFSSYHSHLSDKPTRLCRKQVIEWFGGHSKYLSQHSTFLDERELRSVIFDE